MKSTQRRPGSAQSAIGRVDRRLVGPDELMLDRLIGASLPLRSRIFLRTTAPFSGLNAATSATVMTCDSRHNPGERRRQIDIGVHGPRRQRRAHCREGQHQEFTSQHFSVPLKARKMRITKTRKREITKAVWTG